jgi:hypothetical protein
MHLPISRHKKHVLYAMEQFEDLWLAGPGGMATWRRISTRRATPQEPGALIRFETADRTTLAPL